MIRWTPEPDPEPTTATLVDLTREYGHPSTVRRGFGAAMYGWWVDDLYVEFDASRSTLRQWTRDEPLVGDEGLGC